MHQINPKKFKEIKNKTIPSPLRPKFRKKAEANIYFLSQRKVSSEKKSRLIKKIRSLPEYTAAPKIRFIFPFTSLKNVLLLFFVFFCLAISFKKHIKPYVYVISNKSY